MAEEKILVRVQKLLATAEHENTPQHEKDAALAMANKLMTKHAIDEAMLAATQKPSERRKPVREDIKLFDPNSLHSYRFKTILSEIARTTRVKAALLTNGNVVLVGFSDDVSYTQMLFHSVHYSFLSALQPGWDSSREFDDNVYRLKEAGVKWVSIANMANRNGEDVPWPDGGRLIRAYKRQCKKLGVEPTAHTQRHDAYRESYAEAFTQRICERLETMRWDAKQQAKESTGAELVLRDASAEIDEAWYEIFPNQRPMSAEEQKRMMEEYQERMRLEQEKHEAWWNGLTEAQKIKHQEKEERERQKRAAADERYWAKRAKEDERWRDRTGERRGRKAADTVDLVRKDTVGTTSRGEIDG